MRQPGSPADRLQGVGGGLFASSDSTTGRTAMFAILLSALAVAADDVEPPVQKAVTPRFVLVALKGDQLVHRAIVPVTVAVTKQVEVDVNGKKETRNVVEYQTRTEVQEQKW